jgi:uncharacterized protein (TIGR02996 family)
MLVEDPFLDAILDEPTDEALRLIYADWLEERSDSRSQYLREEVEVFRSATGEFGPNTNRLMQLEQGIDPVWAARISRPPVGVCCVRVQFANWSGGETRPQLRPTAFRLLESWLGTDLPPAYRAFLLNYNGGQPKPNQLDLPSGLHREIYWMLSIWSPEGQPEDFDLDLVSFAEDHLRGNPPLRSPGIGIPVDCIKVGVCVLTGEGDTLCLAFTGERRGQVVLVNPALGRHDEAITTPVAASFPKFLAMLH